jgi:plastocyanin
MTPSTTRPRILVAALAITLAFIAAGCGSSGGSDASATTAVTGGSTTAASGSSDAPVKLQGTVNDKGTKDISGGGDQAHLEMELDDDYFSPTYIKAAPGATVTVELENEGDTPHTFTLDDGSVDKKLDPGAKATVEVTIPQDGPLRFSCDFHGSMGMQGAFYTGRNGSTASAGGEATTTSAPAGGTGY